jgi:hypothetical protein
MLADVYRTQEMLNGRPRALLRRRPGESDDQLVARVAVEVKRLWQETGRDTRFEVTRGPGGQLQFHRVPNELPLQDAEQIVCVAVGKGSVRKQALLYSFFAYCWGETFHQARGAIERAQERYPQDRPGAR